MRALEPTIGFLLFFLTICMPFSLYISVGVGQLELQYLFGTFQKVSGLVLWILERSKSLSAGLQFFVLSYQLHRGASLHIFDSQRVY